MMMMIIGKFEKNHRRSEFTRRHCIQGSYDIWVFGASTIVSDSGLILGDFGQFCMILDMIPPMRSSLGALV